MRNTKKQPPATGIRQMMDACPDWVWMRDPKDGRIFDVNRAAAKGLGYSRRELLGRTIFDFYFHEADRDIGHDFQGKISKDGSAYLTATFRTKSGKPVEVEMRGSLMKHRGRPAMLVFARDYGPLLRDQRLALILHQAFKHSNDVMFYSDRNGTILDVNDAFTQHYGFSREETIGRTPRILRSSHSTREFYEKMWSDITGKGYWRGQIINRAKDGREIPLILTITAVKGQSGRTIGYISNAIDMSEQLALQARVADSEALAAVGEMAAVVAHEIRNPLGSIVMAAKQLVEGNLDASDKEMVMQILKEEGRRLNEALTNFLAYARPRELKLQPLGLNSLVEEVCRILRANTDLAKNVRMKLELDKSLEPIQLDPDQIRQVVWNIILNAFQAIKGMGTVTVRTGQGGGFAFIQVKDTGPGIHPSAQSTIFKPFHTTKQQGTGLGLAIADRIAKAHGGRIKVESHGGGATFTVYLPAPGR